MRTASKSRNDELLDAVEEFREAILSTSSEQIEAAYRRLNDECTRLGVPLQPK